MREPLSDSNRSRIFRLAKGIHERRATAAAVLHEETGEAGVVEQPGELGLDDAHILRPLGHGQAGELFDRNGVGPVVRHRAQVIEPVRIGHRSKVRRVLAEFFVVAVEVAEDRLEFHDPLAVERDDHAEHAVRGRVVRPHRDLEQVTVEFIVHRPDVRAARLRQEGRMTNAQWRILGQCGRKSF